MFGFDLGDMKERLRDAFDARLRVLAGVAFTALAMAAIEYDEIIAPEVSKFSDAWSSVATDFSRKLGVFSL